jgi:hypothetical protein
MAKSESFPTLFKADTKDGLLEGHLYGGLRKDLNAFEHPLKGLDLKGLTINVGVAKYDMAKTELVVKESPFELKLNKEKGEGEIKMTVKDMDMMGGFTNAKDGPVKFWVKGQRSLGFATVCTRVHLNEEPKSELGVKSEIAGLACAADMVFETLGPPKTGIFGASYKLPLAMDTYVGLVAKYAAAGNNVDASAGVFAKLPAKLIPGTESASVGAEMFKSGAVLGGAKVVVDKTLSVQTNCALTGAVQASVVWSGLSAATVTCGYEGKPLDDPTFAKAKFGLQVKLK